MKSTRPMPRAPTTLRDNPAALALALLGLLGILLTLGYLTVRIGSAWARHVAHRLTQVEMQQP